MASDEIPTFAYMLFSCDWREGLGEEFRDWYYGDIIECFAEGEDQADSLEHLWSFGWEDFMNRAAPVQLTLGFDVRRPILESLESIGVEPFFRIGYFNEQDNVLAFRIGDAGPRIDPRNHSAAENPNDVERFGEVLRSTVTLARSEGRSLLFVGGWGWYYDMEIPLDVQKLIGRCGMEFVNRHP
jgi:hypothetical protein